MNQEGNFQEFIFCPNCGKKNNKSSQNCWKCRIALTGSGILNSEKPKSSKTTDPRLKKLTVLIVIFLFIGIIIFASNFEDIVGRKEVINRYKSGVFGERYSLVKINSEWIIDGEYTSFYENGKLRSKTRYDIGKINGNYRTYYETGELRNKTQYVKGQLNGDYFTYYKNGSVDTVMYFQDGSKTGQFFEYDSRNNILTMGQFLRDKKDGEWIYKDDGGVILKRELYNEGTKLALTEYWWEGIIRHFVRYDNYGEILIEDYFDDEGNNCFKPLIGSYKKIDEEIHSTNLISRGNEEIIINTDKTYYKKDYSYYEDTQMALESINNIRGIVRVTTDSIYFIPKEKKSNPSRIYMPSIDNRGWKDTSEENWSNCKGWNAEGYSISEFFSIYNK